MLAVSVISTKGGAGKTTVTANLGGILADAGLRVLLLDIEIQPALSSYYKITKLAPCGIYELIAYNERELEHIISHTSIENLHLVYSNDPKVQLNTLLLHAPDGRLRLRNLLPIFKEHYDVVLIDTQGARGVMLEMAVLASDMIISTVTPDMLTAREFQRGTIDLINDLKPFELLGIKIPSVNLLFNIVPPVSNTSKLIQAAVRELFNEHPRIALMQTNIPQLEIYKEAAYELKPAHRKGRRRPSGQKSPCPLETMKSLICEIFPQWQEQCLAVDGKKR